MPGQRRTPAESFTHFKNLEQGATAIVDRDGIHILRLDGRAFSSYTRGLTAPFDPQFAAAMDTTAQSLTKELSSLITFVASDEISVVLAARDERSQLPFGGSVPKLLSLSAAHVTAVFNHAHYERHGRLATFDARVVSVDSPADVLDYLIWRQADTYRNAVMMAAQSLFSHKQLHGVGTREARTMVEQHNGAPFTTTYPARFYLGRHVERHTATETVTYTHKRTGQENTVTVDRTRLVAEPAPSYRDMAVEQVADMLGR